MESYRDLIVWQRSMDLVEEVYSLVKSLPKEETYSLADQMRRAAVSIPSNIAEGYGRNAVKDYLRFLNIARGSKHELETQQLICVRLHYLQENDTQRAMTLCSEIGRMLNSLNRKLLPSA